MINISITEKLWDGVRPSSVKKTGLSEAIRTFTKLSAKMPDTPKGFEELTKGIQVLASVITETESVVKKATDDKKGAAAKLKAWKSECDKAELDLEKHRQQTGLLKAVNEAEQKMKGLAQQVEDAITDAAALVDEIKQGKLKDNKKAAQRLQDLRSAMRDGLKAVQKDGFVDYIRTIEPVLQWKLNPADVPQPPQAKKIKERLPVLQEAAEKARVATEQLLVAGDVNRTGDVAELAADLVKSYRGLAKTLKGWLPAAKKLGTDAHALGDKFKEHVGKGTPHDKLLPLLDKMHEKVMAFDTTTLTELARGRIARGDIQAERIKLRDSLSGDARKQFEAIASDEWNLCMVIYRELSEQVAEAHRQVDRVARLVGAVSPEAGQAAELCVKRYDGERSDLKNKFLK